MNSAGVRPVLTVRRARGEPRAAALVLHGGAEHGLDRVRPWRAAYLRMVPFARALASAYGDLGLDVHLLRNRVRGWNEPDRDPVTDARWALERIRATAPGMPIVLVGHSMGGRVALRIADADGVAAVCALAPWTPEGEPVEPVRDRTVLIAHGSGDERTSPAASLAYATRAAPVAARLARVEIAGERHAMLRRPGLWRRLVLDATARGLTLPGAVDAFDRVWCDPAPGRLSISL